MASAHRAPKRVQAYARDAAARGIKVIIAVAGMAAHLAGVLAAETTLPVIGVPMPASHLNGLDSLLSTVQMPAGVPVATMAVGAAGAKNAAIFAAQILALGEPRLQERLQRHKKELEEQVAQQGDQIPGRVSPWRIIAGEGCGHDDHHHGGPGRRFDGSGTQLSPVAPSLCSPGRRCSAVVKADAYGHGLLPVARKLATAGADYLGVGSLEEGWTLRQAKISLPVLLLLGLLPEEAEPAVATDLEASLFRLDVAQALAAAAANQGKKARVHLKVDTGMGRLGVLPQEVVPFLASLKKMRHLRSWGSSPTWRWRTRPTKRILINSCRNSLRFWPRPGPRALSCRSVIFPTAPPSGSCLRRMWAWCGRVLCSTVRLLPRIGRRRLSSHR